jgi:hypothetical protein
LVEGLESDRASVKYGCLKVLRIVSEKKPVVLYPHFDLFVDLLDSDNKFMQWGAIRILSNLASADRERKFRKIFRKYFKPVTGSVMVTAANVIGGAADIARAQPELTTRVVSEILKVEKARYRTAECRSVAIGHAIHSLDQFFGQIKAPRRVIQFVRRQRRNRRPATRRRAETFLNKHSPPTC